MSEQQLTAKEIQKILSKREHALEMNRKRVKKHYDKHKDELVEKQREKRAAERAQTNLAVSQLAIVPHDPQKEEEESKEDFGVVKTFENVNDYTQDQLIQLLRDKGLEKGSFNTYRSAANRIFKITGCKSLIECFQNVDKMMDDIDNSTNDNGIAYSINTIKATYQGVLYLIDNFLLVDGKKNEFLSDVHKKVNKRFKRYKDLSEKESNKKKTSTEYAVPSFVDYVDACREKYGTESKQYLVAVLYSVIPVRDNFKNMKIIKSLAENNGVDNFLVATRSTYTFVINDFKTKKGGDIEPIEKELQDELPKEIELIELLKEWIKIKKLKYGSLLFGKSPLSPFVSKMNRELGFSTGVDLFRHITVSDIPDDAPIEERERIAESMQHSLQTQAVYARQKKTKK